MAMGQNCNILSGKQGSTRSFACLWTHGVVSKNPRSWDKTVIFHEVASKNPWPWDKTAIFHEVGNKNQQGALHVSGIMEWLAKTHSHETKL